MVKQTCHPVLLAITLFVLPPSLGYAATSASESVQVVTQMPGLVAFWDFVKREPGDSMRFTAHVSAGATTDYPLDVATTPIAPPTGPTHWLFHGPPAESKFLAAKLLAAYGGMLREEFRAYPTMSSDVKYMVR